MNKLTVFPILILAILTSFQNINAASPTPAYTPPPPPPANATTIEQRQYYAAKEYYPGYVQYPHTPDNSIFPVMFHYNFGTNAEGQPLAADVFVNDVTLRPEAVDLSEAYAAQLGISQHDLSWYWVPTATPNYSITTTSQI